MSGDLTRKMRYVVYRSIDQSADKNPSAIRLYRRNRKSRDDVEDQIYVMIDGRGYLQPRDSFLA